ncbi:MAG: hypothetical protein O7G28_11105, partial [Deltaproteobacteria bacterium]|nr:hypothetical protein [Deltaproteobacteria bacterium]
PPPALRASGWVGDAEEPGTASRDVTLVAFFSVAHPQTRDVLELLIPWGKTPGMRVIGVASVVDNPNSQTPDRLRRIIAGYRLPFPVALDEQRTGGKHSVSLGLYLGKRVPWMALLDRYGRIRAVQGIPLKGNALSQTQHMFRQLVAEPDYEDLKQTLLEGGKSGADALATLATIRTVRTANLLIEMKGQMKEKMKDMEK